MSQTSTRDAQVVVDEDGHVWRVRERPEPVNSSPGLDLRLLLPALLAWAVAAVALTTPGAVRLVAGCIGLLLGAFGAWWGRPRHRRGSHAALRVSLSLSSIGIVLLGAGAADLIRHSSTVDELAARSAVARLRAIAIAEPVPVANGRVLVRLKVLGVEAGGSAQRGRGQVLILGDDRWSGIRWHDQVAVLARLRPTEPGDAALAFAKPLGAPVITRSRSPAVVWSERVRSRFRDAVTDLPPDPRGLVPAMVFGDTSRSPPELTDDLREAGLAHLSAVSGANVSLTLAAAMPVLALMGVPRRGRPVCLLGVIAVFVLITRPEPSVIRAAVMGAVGLLAIYRSTRAAGPPALGAAIVGLLLIDPWLARSVGFALSALATLGLVVFAGPWTTALAPRMPWGSKTLAAALVVPVAAQLMTAPVVVVLQGQLSVIGIPANVLAAPLVAPVTIAGLLVAALASVGLSAAWLAWLPGAPALVICVIGHRAAGLSWANLGWPAGPVGVLLLLALSLVALLSGPRILYAVRRRPRSVAAAALLGVCLVAPTSSLAWPPPRWQLVACDIGQGDALVLATTPGRAILIDAGPDAAAVDRCLRRLRVRALDLIVLTHFHADHVDGLSGAVHDRPTGEILVSATAEPADRAAAVRRLAGAHGIPLRAAVAGERLVAGPLELWVLAPTRAIHAGSVPNNASLVLWARHGDFDALLTGDIEAEAGALVRAVLLPILAAAQGNSRLDVIKAPHHGSANLDPGLTSAARAPVTLVSVGADNDYGHPSPRMLDLARAAGSTVLRTDQSGDIAVWVQGTNVTVRTQR